MIVKTRDFNPETDTGFILASMPKEIYYDGKPTRKGRANKKWFEEFHAYLLDQIEHAYITIATTDEDQDFILGYAIFNKDQLEFVYVKEAYRKQHIGTMLSEQRLYTTVNQKNLTILGKKIMQQNAQPRENVLMTNNQTKIDSPGVLESLIQSGIPLKKVTFQSAILSGFNQPEFQLDISSRNSTRVPESMYFTPYGVVITQKELRCIVPHSNIIQADVKWEALKDHEA